MTVGEARTRLAMAEIMIVDWRQQLKANPLLLYTAYSLCMGLFARWVLTKALKHPDLFGLK
jgi:hypothetical protein